MSSPSILCFFELGKVSSLDLVDRFKEKQDLFIISLTDRLVILGNHRDAWVFGAADPSSGTATMLEMARAFGWLKKQGI